MNEYVWGAIDSTLVRFGACWWADDPIVLKNPEWFSATPVLVHGSDPQRMQPQPTPVSSRPTSQQVRRG